MIIVFFIENQIILERYRAIMTHDMTVRNEENENKLQKI